LCFHIEPWFAGSVGCRSDVVLAFQFLSLRFRSFPAAGGVESHKSKKPHRGWQWGFGNRRTKLEPNRPAAQSQQAKQGQVHVLIHAGRKVGDRIRAVNFLFPGSVVPRPIHETVWKLGWRARRQGIFGCVAQFVGKQGMGMAA
jgi:hypothetical protein